MNDEKEHQSIMALSCRYEAFLDGGRLRALDCKTFVIGETKNAKSAT